MSAAEVRSRLEEIGLNEHKELVRRVRVHCRSQDVAEDSVQEAYVELLLHADEIRSVDSIKAWLLRVAVREARKSMEKYYRMYYKKQLFAVRHAAGSCATKRNCSNGCSPSSVISLLINIKTAWSP